jgi:hypothetical protein
MKDAVLFRVAAHSAESPDSPGGERLLRPAHHANFLSARLNVLARPRPRSLLTRLALWMHRFSSSHIINSHRLAPKRASN